MKRAMHLTQSNIQKKCRVKFPRHHNKVVKQRCFCQPETKNVCPNTKGEPCEKLSGLKKKIVTRLLSDDTQEKKTNSSVKTCFTFYKMNNIF